MEITFPLMRITLSAVSVDNYRSCDQANARHAAARAPEERMTRRGDTSAYERRGEETEIKEWMDGNRRKERKGWWEGRRMSLFVSDAEEKNPIRS